MIFVMLAIGRGSFTWRASRICPVSRSASSAARALSSGATVASAGVESLLGNGERLPCGGTGVGGGPAAPVATPETSAIGASSAATTIAAASARARTSGLTRRTGGPAARSAAAPA